MLSVRVVKVVWTADAETVESWRVHLPSDLPKAPRAAHLCFDLELPFAPYPGLSLGRDSWDAGPLRKVRWDDADQRFICLADEVYSVGEAAFDTQMEVDIGAGWTRFGGDAPGWVQGIVAGDDE